MSDPFLDEVRADWQAQDPTVEAALRNIRRRRWQPWRELAWDLLGVTASLVFGGYFAWRAIDGDPLKLLYAASAAVLLIGPPSAFAAILLARRRSLAWSVKSPEALLQTGLQRAETRLSVARMSVWSHVVLGAFVIALWSLELLGLVQARGFVLIYSVVSLIAALGAWRWSAAAAKRARRDRQVYETLLADYADPGN